MKMTLNFRLKALLEITNGWSTQTELNKIYLDAVDMEMKPTN